MLYMRHGTGAVLRARMDEEQFRRLHEEKERRNLEQARRQHDDLTKLGMAYLTSAVTMSSDAIKAAAVVNGGPAAALLAFLGTGRTTPTWAYLASLAVFAAGFLCASFSSAFGYGAQLNYGNEQMEMKRSFDHPYAHETEASEASRKRALRYHSLGFWFVMAAYGLAVLGMALAALGFKAASLPPSFYPA